MPTDLTLPQQFQYMLQNPTPDEIIKLQPALIALSQNEAVQKAYTVVTLFYNYMAAIQAQVEPTKLPSVISSLAALVAGISVSKDIFKPDDPNVLQSSPDVLKSTLATLNSLSFVRQWEANFATTHVQTVWQLYEYYWRMSLDLQPYLNLGERDITLGNLFKQCHSPSVEPAVKIITVMQLFYWAVMARMYPVIQLYNQLIGGR
jgi:hypothetical protein